VATPSTRPKATARAKPKSVTQSVNDALNQIGPRYCQSAAKLALGVGRMNSGMAKTRQASSQSRNSASVATQGASFSFIVWLMRRAPR
jgi:hypothetical protein